MARLTGLGGPRRPKASVRPKSKAKSASTRKKPTLGGRFGSAPRSAAAAKSSAKNKRRTAADRRERTPTKKDERVRGRRPARRKPVGLSVHRGTRRG